MERRVLFVISSAIHITDNPLCYTPTRSAFSVEERAQQTVKTVQSIRISVPGAHILLIELGLRRDLPFRVDQMVDKYLFLGNRRIVRSAADGPYKGLGEALGLYLANRAIQSFDPDYLFKLSGRYYLNENFRTDDWVADGYTCRNYFGGLETVLYGFTKRLYPNWRTSLRSSFPVLRQGESLEIIQARFLEKPLHYQSRIGVSGWESHSGNFRSL